MRQTQENLLIRHRCRLCLLVKLVQFVFKFVHFLQNGIPSSLQFCGNQPLFGIYRFVSPSGQACFVVSLLKFQLDRLAQILSSLLHLLCGFYSRLNRLFAGRL